jgi:hypothetical protein
MLYLLVYPIPKEELNRSNLPTLTELGGEYEHNIESTILENGYYIHYFICFSELDSVWQSRTGEQLFDESKPELFPTLIRYMTSLGLKKDGLGLSKLSNEDINNVRKGYPSVIYAKGGLRARLATITMELQKHLEGADPNGSTIQQRFEYWKTALKIIKGNIVLGVGIGDIQTSFDDQFEKDNSPLKPENRLHSHQQFLTFWIGSGLIGFVVFILHISLTLISAIRLNSYMLLISWTVITFSYFFEDTLETQVGVTLAAFFMTFIMKQEKHKILF